MDLSLPVKKRNLSIDILRSLALCGVIIAHCAPSNLWLQIRNFDVPLMVILSAVSYALASKYRNDSWSGYCVKRIKRLVFPTWIFLTIYFIAFYNKMEMNLSIYLSIYLSSYLLIWGIGYVWIIRVFIVVAMFAPFLYGICNKIKSAIVFWIWLFLLLCLNECMIYLLPDWIGGSIIMKQILVTLPYLLVFMVGLRVCVARKSETMITALLFTFLFIIMSVYQYLQLKEFVSTQIYKYPPQIYYLSYAFGVSLFLFLFKDGIVKFVYNVSSRLGNSMCWIGQHTLWIYFWHIMFVAFSEQMDSSILRFLFVFLGASLCTYLQCLLLKVLYPYIKKSSLKKNLAILFEG